MENGCKEIKLLSDQKNIKIYCDHSSQRRIPYVLGDNYIACNNTCIVTMFLFVSCIEKDEFFDKTIAQNYIIVHN